MRRRIEALLRTAAACTLLLGLSALASQLIGGQLRGFQGAHPARQQAAAPQTDAQQKQTFEGTIARSGGKLLLQDKIERVSYQLDDQQLAELFEGKQVKMTGILDTRRNTIYISDIALLNAKHAATRTTPERHRLLTQMQYGIASWYERDNQGPWTASGEPFEDQALTAAHPKLPLGSRVKVTNLTNGHSVLVRINDRGPFIHGRLIDVSKRAAEKLGFIDQGLTAVGVSVVSMPGGVPTS